MSAAACREMCYWLFQPRNERSDRRGHPGKSESGAFCRHRELASADDYCFGGAAPPLFFVIRMFFNAPGSVWSSVGPAGNLLNCSK